MLRGPRGGQVRLPSIVDEAIGPQSGPAGRSDDAAAPIAEDITVGENRHRRVGHQVIGDDDVGCPREMDPEDHDHRCRLWKVVDQLVADTDFHSAFRDSFVTPVAALGPKCASRIPRLGFPVLWNRLLMLRLSKYFGATAEFWMNLQNRHELQRALLEIGGDLE